MDSPPVRPRVGVTARTLRPAPDGDARDTAFWALEEGLWPVALHAPGTPLGDDRRATGKEPVRSRWGDATPTSESLRHDFNGPPNRGVGLRLGPTGGWGDIEGDGPAWNDQFIDLCGGEALDTLGWDSRRGGHNMVATCPPELASIPSGFKAPWSEFSDLEVRINGPDRQSQSVIPPTVTDDFLRRWRGPWRIAPLPEAAIEALEKLWREDQARKRKATSAGKRDGSKRKAEGAGAVSTIDQWNQEQGAGGIVAMLEGIGWRVVKEAADGVVYIRHPEATGPWSASIGWCGPKLYCWSNNTAFPVGKPLDAFDVYRVLEHGDDFRRALEALRERGYGRNGRSHSGANGKATAKAGPRPSANGGGRDGDGEAVGQDGPGEDRPEVVVTTEEHEVIDQFISALEGEPTIFQRGNGLVRVQRDGIKGRGFRRPPNTPRITPIPAARLREILTRRTQIVKPRRDRNGETTLVPAHPPEWAVAGVLARSEWEGVRHLEGVVEAPTIRPDGSILDAPGWDEETGLLYEPNGEFNSAPPTPTRDDAKEAAGRLLALVVDFPFAGPAHKSVWLAGVLEVFARWAIDGPCPLIAFDANCPGTGKSKLVDLIAIIATGRDAPRTAYPDSDEEMRKRITSIALAGDRLMLLDNIDATFGGSALDSALTANVWRDRVLGKSEMTQELPLFACWFASGNNLSLRGDAVRRVVPCRLVTTEDRPEERNDFAVEGDLLKHARQHRPRLVADALTILQAHAVAGRPSGGLTPLGSFESWSEVVRSAVHWVIGLDPCATREELRASDPETNARVALVDGWAELPGSHRGLTVAEALRVLRDPDKQDHFTTLRDALMEMSRNDALPSALVVGKRLKAIKDRPVNGKALRATPYKGTQVWRVEPASGGSGGSDGSLPLPRAKNCADTCKTKFTPNEGQDSRHPHHSHRSPPEVFEL